MRTKTAVTMILALVLAGGAAAADTNIKTSNSSEDVNAESGTASGSNSSNSFVGHASSGQGNVTVSDIDNSSGTNVQEGDNTVRATQTTNVRSGDTVGGQAMGVVSSGNANITASNHSEDVDLRSGDATGDNDFLTFVGLAAAGGTISIDDITNSPGTNVQEGDNAFSLRQSSDADTGDAVSGQVIGAVASGDVTIDATNTSIDNDATTGDADAINDAAGFVGLAAAGDISIADIDSSPATNVHEGDSDFSVTQSADASSGDAVTGQALAGVTAGVVVGGTADITVSNETTDSDARTGNAVETNDASFFNGLAESGGGISVTDLVGSFFETAL